MINNLLERLNGSASDPQSLQTALAELAAEQNAVRISIESSNEKRRQLLLDDAPDSALDKIEREIDRATIRLEKLNLAEQPLRERAEAAKAQARQRRYASHREAYVAQAVEFIATARACHAAHTKLVDIVTQAQREGFSIVAATPNINGNAICAPDLIDIFERVVMPAEPRKGKPIATGTAPKTRTRLPHERAALTDQGPIYPFEPLARPKTVPTPDDADQLGPDEVRAVVIRPGFQGPTGQCRAGQKIRLQRGVAEIAARSGAIEIVEARVGLPDSILNDRTFQKVST